MVDGYACLGDLYLHQLIHTQSRPTLYMRTRTKSIIAVVAVLLIYQGWNKGKEAEKSEKLAELHRVVDSFTTRRGDSIHVIVMPCARTDGATGHQIEYLRDTSVIDRGCAVLVQRHRQWAVEWNTAPFELQTIHTDYSE
ncbi:hypothetical protein [Caballeronia sp. INML2]|uniref:hypothetical protein n=1 Tax=Caballeronia sp. INML2 TaxID=2921748 RepID=UPI0020280711|nr:hypothetical protein [Caballeronia sp. INML2]